MSFHQLLVGRRWSRWDFFASLPQELCKENQPKEKKAPKHPNVVGSFFFFDHEKNIMTRWLFKTYYSILVVRFHWSMILVGGGDSPSWKNDWMADLKNGRRHMELGTHSFSRSKYQQHHPLPLQQLEICQAKSGETAVSIWNLKAAESMWNLTAKIGSKSTDTIFGSNPQLSTGKHRTYVMYHHFSHV